MAAVHTSPPSNPGSTGDFSHAAHEPLHLPDHALNDSHISHPLEEREFAYNWEEKKGVAVASLKILAPAAFSKNIPTFLGSGPVKGTAVLNLDKPDTIKSVVVSVRGRFSSRVLGSFIPGTTDGSVEMTLFSISDTLWSRDSEDSSAQLEAAHGKLSGTHSWPFSVIIPEKIKFAPDQTVHDDTEYNTLQTFSERVLTAGISYEVILHVKRGTFENDYDIRCTIGYIPLIRPPPFPAPRAAAYQEGLPLPGPSRDNDGWISTENTVVLGTLLDSRSVTVDCQLFMSKPLAYARATVIPLFIRIQSADQEALDLLATPKSIVVRLQRTIQYCPPMESLANPKHNHAAHDIRDMIEAVWVPEILEEQDGKSADDQMRTVSLSGELHLRADLYPSTTFPIFTVNYHICLRPFDAAGFKMKNPPKSILEAPVDIVTFSAPGPHAVRYAPPGYDEDRPIRAEYDIALGMLGIHQD